MKVLADDRDFARDDDAAGILAGSESPLIWNVITNGKRFSRLLSRGEHLRFDAMQVDDTAPVSAILINIASFVTCACR